MNSDEILKALDKHLAEVEDIELMLLKGHLILEQVLNELLILYFNNRKNLENLNLMFSKKLELLVGLKGPLTGMKADMAHLKEINRIRNKLAHQLEFDEYHTDLKKWACGVIGNVPKTIDRKSTYLNTVRHAFTWLAAKLSGFAEGVEAVEANLKEVSR